MHHLPPGPPTRAAPETPANRRHQARAPRRRMTDVLAMSLKAATGLNSGLRALESEMQKPQIAEAEGAARGGAPTNVVAKRASCC